MVNKLLMLLGSNVTNKRERDARMQRCLQARATLHYYTTFIIRTTLLYLLHCQQARARRADAVLSAVARYSTALLHCRTAATLQNSNTSTLLLCTSPPPPTHTLAPPPIPAHPHQEGGDAVAEREGGGGGGGAGRKAARRQQRAEEEPVGVDDEALRDFWKEVPLQLYCDTTTILLYQCTTTTLFYVTTIPSIFILLFYLAILLQYPASWNPGAPLRAASHVPCALDGAAPRRAAPGEC